MDAVDLWTFVALNERKRWLPSSLTHEDRLAWGKLSEAIARVHFGRDHCAESCTRHSLRVPVCLQASYYSRNKRHQVIITNLGERGCFLLTIGTVPPSTVLSFTIRDEIGEHSCAIQGEVVWTQNMGISQSWGIGICFLHMSWNQRQFIYGIVDRSFTAHLGVHSLWPWRTESCRGLV